jgi:hypothetical protein
MIFSRETFLERLCFVVDGNLLRFIRYLPKVVVKKDATVRT